MVGSHGRWKRPLPANSPHDHVILRVDLVGLTREVETPLPSNSPHDHVILRVDLVGLTREVETPLPSNSPHDHVILRVELVGSHGGSCLETTPWRRNRLARSNAGRIRRALTSGGGRTAYSDAKVANRYLGKVWHGATENGP